MLPKGFMTGLQWIAPQHLLSRFAGLIAGCKYPPLKNALIRWFIRRYQVDMSIAKYPNAIDYRHFNDFFTRELQPGARPIIRNELALLSPVDGTIAQIGQLRDGYLIQAKNRFYTLSSLIAEAHPDECLQNGLYTTLYLAPRDYHRIHMPISGRLLKMTYIPGRLFSVNLATAETVPGLFARNERLVCHFETKMGPMILVFVGAMIVASIVTNWAGTIAPARERKLKTWVYDAIPHIAFEQGTDIAHFCLGSTVILILPQHAAQWAPHCKPNTLVQMGQKIADIPKILRNT